MYLLRYDIHGEKCLAFPMESVTYMEKGVYLSASGLITQYLYIRLRDGHEENAVLMACRSGNGTVCDTRRNMSDRWWHTGCVSELDN